MNTGSQQTQPSITLSKTLGGLLLCALPFLLTSSTIPSTLEKIKVQGYLTIISNNGPVTYYEGPSGYTGFEYDLATAFADELGVELVIRDEPNLGDLLNAVGTETGYFGANNLIVTEERRQTINFSEPYLEVKQQVIYQRGDDKPESIEDLLDKDIIVIAASSHAEKLRELKIDYPELSWRELEDVEELDLLEAVHSGKADIAIVDSAGYTINRMVYPRARYAFDLSDPQPIAWAFPKHGDSSLLKAANRFITRAKQTGQLETLANAYFNDEDFDESGALSFSVHIENRLQKWEDLFREAATEYDMDWLFLAAISYQESHWNPQARSYTGVRGMMMLTQATAKQVGVKNRRDPKESIFGGAKYFSQVLNRIPERIESPDRLWMALAAYNVGYGHLEDARILTEAQGGDPDLWQDVRETLPLLSKKKYYKQTRHGYARGWEPVRYVDNIRSYYNVLVWHHESEQRRLAIELQNELQSVGLSSLNDNLEAELPPL